MGLFKKDFKNSNIKSINDITKIGRDFLISPYFLSEKLYLGER